MGIDERGAELLRAETGPSSETEPIKDFGVLEGKLAQLSHGKGSEPITNKFIGLTSSEDYTGRFKVDYELRGLHTDTGRIAKGEILTSHHDYNILRERGDSQTKRVYFAFQDNPTAIHKFKVEWERKE